VTGDIWQTMASEAAAESPLWGSSLRPAAEREAVAVFSPLTRDRYALGLETIYEGYLLHFGRGRLFAPADHDTSLLLGDYLYAHGLVRIADDDSVAAVADLAELISLCAQIQAEGAGDDGPVWAATAAVLGEGRLEAAREAMRLRADAGPLHELACRAAGEEAVAQALATHRRLVG
jgi:hypothetical protein